jgi:hypothetical protein
MVFIHRCNTMHRNNRFGVKGVNVGLDLCHLSAKKVAWVWKCRLGPSSPFLSFPGRFRVKPYPLKQKIVELIAKSALGFRQVW